MDRNQATGIMLILLMLFVYFQFFAPNPQPKQVTKDTAGVREQTPQNQSTPEPVLGAPGADTTAAYARLQQQYGELSTVATGQDQDVTIENKDVQVTLGAKGGRIKRVLLKNYRTYDGQPLVLHDEQSSDMMYTIPTATGEVQLHNLYFSPNTSSVQATGSDTARLVFRASVADGRYIEQVYTLAESGFQLNHNLRFVGLDNIVRNEPVQFYWLNHMPRFERDMEQSRITSTVNYYITDDGFEQLSEGSKGAETETISAPLDWVSFKQKFFLSAIIGRGTTFSSGEVASNVNPADSNTVKTVEARLTIPANTLSGNGGNYTFYFGPNDYQIVRNVAEGFRENVYLGWPVVRVVNRFFIVPLFHLLEQVFTNYGVIIICLVLIVRLVLFPLTYRSYISMAKTRVLQPEIQALKEKYDGDMQKVQQEQMKLFQQVGVNPLSGCIPVLLQMPILLALFSLFPNLIEFRQQSFLWADDLSTYDSIASLPFVIPFYGSHVSLFTILMTISSVAFAYFNSQMSASTMQGPMQSLQYIMPVMFMFILNSLPAGLTFYYFVGNVVSIAQQLIIRQFVDEDKIKRTLEENWVKNKDRKKSKFQQRLEDALKNAEEAKKKK